MAICHVLNKRWVRDRAEHQAGWVEREAEGSTWQALRGIQVESWCFTSGYNVRLCSEKLSTAESTADSPP